MKRNEIIVEILIWISILVALFSGAALAYHNFYVKPNTYTILFKDIDGITAGSPVRFMGINIGHVRKLTSIDKSIAVKILVTKKDLKIPNGTTARVEFYGLGGSKSIELMPSNVKDFDGIVTNDTIRIADITRQAKGFVEILEIIDKFVQSLDENAIQGILEAVEDVNPDKISQIETKMKKTGRDLTAKVDDIKGKQTAMAKTIQKANDMVLKINKFVKK